MKTEILRMEHITRYHSGIKILDDLKLNVYKGEVLGIIGLSGTGKTAISSILAGIEPVDDGSIYFNEQQMPPLNRSIVRQNNVFTVFHTARLVPQISIAENIFVIKDNSFKKILINKKAINHQAEVLLNQVGLKIPSQTLAGELSLAEQHLVELAKAIAASAKLIILDDITESYTFRELTRLVEIINKLKKRGIAFLYESHKPEELMGVADRITILRSGKNVKTLYRGEYDKDAIFSYLVGSEFREGLERENTAADDVVLRVKDICTENIHNISFELHKGEVLGIFDLENKGNTEIYNLISGAIQPSSGEVFLDGCKFTVKDTTHAIKSGIGIVPEGAVNSTLLQNMSYAENLSFLIMKKMSNSFMRINKRLVSFIAREHSRFMEINHDDINTKVQSFDMHTRQKIMLYKWLLYHPKILVCANLGAMLDIVTKKMAYEFVNEAAQKGIGILIATSDILEAASICDRVVVISGNSIKGEYTRDEVIGLNVHELY